jgi:hypothetical protein
LAARVRVVVAAAAHRRRELGERLRLGGFAGPHIVGYPRGLLPDEK